MSLPQKCNDPRTDGCQCSQKPGNTDSPGNKGKDYDSYGCGQQYENWKKTRHGYDSGAFIIFLQKAFGI